MKREGTSGLDSECGNHGEVHVLQAPLHADLAQKPQINANLSCPMGRNTSIKNKGKKTKLLSGDGLGWGWGVARFCITHKKSLSDGF